MEFKNVVLTSKLATAILSRHLPMVAASAKSLRTNSIAMLDLASDLASSPLGVSGVILLLLVELLTNLVTDTS
jgi:hypothetical protein